MNIREYLESIHNDKEKLSALKSAAEAGKDKEFLAAEGVELPTELGDDALAAVAGGCDGSEGDKPEITTETVVYRRDSRGNPTHWKQTEPSDGSYEIYHYKCESCGRTLHQGFLDLYYCDPCDDWYFSPEKVIDQKG